MGRVASLVVVALALLLTGTAVGAPTGPATAGKLTWKDCGDGFECAKLAVPRDWDRPRNGETIKLSLIRLPATSPRPVGSLLVNFGGPGATGVGSLRGSGELIREATLGRMHVVSWDPRGVGESAPIRCPEGNEAYFEADPFTEAGLRQMGAAVAERARACSARYGEYLSDIGTDQVVRDMDAIRAAVGDRKTSFLGLSYGTRVGAVYAQTFPRRVRTMVLDGSLPPVSTLTEISEGLATAFEGALNEYFARCVTERPSCVFGDDPAAGFDALVRELRESPPEVPGTGGRRLTVALFYQVVLALIINYGGSTQAAEAVIGEYLTSGDPTNLYAFTQIIAGGRQPDGTFLSNGPETFQFINCLDWQDRPTVEQVMTLAEESKAIAPRLGPFGVTFALMNMTACPERAKPVPPPTSPEIPPVLVVGNDNDAETPLHSSQLLSESLPGSRLLVFQGFGHTAFTTSPCVASKAGRYLVTGRLPRVGTFCPNLPLAPLP
jgi:pimeloyl-ACP methyl ester carboxylesterase